MCIWSFPAGVAGRIVLDEPTTLPDGTVIDLVADDEGDDLSDEERRALHEALSASWRSAEAGGLRLASAILDELRRRRCRGRSKPHHKPTRRSDKSTTGGGRTGVHRQTCSSTNSPPRSPFSLTHRKSAHYIGKPDMWFGVTNGASEMPPPGVEVFLS